MQESVDLVKSTKSNNKASKEEFESNIDHYHPNRFSPKTLSAVSRNIVSSWKQAGYILGKMKNIRTINPPSYFAVAFAFLLAYLDDFRGDYLFDHPSVKSLDASKEEIMLLLKAASDRELLNFNRSGASIVISFEQCLKTLMDV